jgi:hypothetical protein
VVAEALAFADECVQLAIGNSAHHAPHPVRPVDHNRAP